MATKLAPLRSRLTTLRRQRWTQRVIHGAMAFAFLLLAALAADFLLDWMLAFSRPVRIVILGFFGGLSIWAFRKFLWPALAVRESDLDVALLVERCQGIDSDLVAALQFESPEAATWGSPRLAATVVDRVAEFGNSLDVKRGLPPGRNRVGYALAGLAFLLLAASAVFPDHVRTFADRILLGSAHYPTRTHITRIAVNGSHADESPSRPRIPFGGAAHFEVEAAGVCPASGSIQIVADASGESVVVNLVPVNDSKIQASTSDPRSESTKTYTAELARLTAPVNYQVFLGDAWTEPAVLDVIPPPVVSLELEYSPPAYAA